MFRCQLPGYGRFTAVPWKRLQFVRFDTLTFAVHDDPLAAFLKTPVLGRVKRSKPSTNSPTSGVKQALMATRKEVVPREIGTRKINAFPQQG